MNSIFFTIIFLFHFSTWFYCTAFVFPEVCNYHFSLVHKIIVFVRFSNCPARSSILSKAWRPHSPPIPQKNFLLKSFFLLQYGPGFPTAAGHDHSRTSFHHHCVAWVLWEICQLPIIFTTSLWREPQVLTWHSATCYETHFPAFLIVWSDHTHFWPMTWNEKYSIELLTELFKEIDSAGFLLSAFSPSSNLHNDS